MRLTIHEKAFVESASERLAGRSAREVIEALLRMGVINPKMCRVAVVRDCIARLRRDGERITDAMWIAAERYALSYEFVRQCVYYHKGVNMDGCVPETECLSQATATGLSNKKRRS